MHLFADTGYWIALLNPADSLHSKAVTLSKHHAAAAILTTEMVLVELANSFSDSGPHLRQAAANAILALRRSSRVTVEPQTQEQFAGALERYQRAADKQWSLTDCASFASMEDRGVQAALTYDHHFVQAGFVALLR